MVESIPVTYSVGQIAEALRGRVVGDGGATVDRICGLENSGPGALTFVTSERHIRLLEAQRPTAVICGREIPESPTTLILVDNVQAGLIQALGMFAPRRIVRAGIHPDATAEPTAIIARSASIAAGAIIGPGARIGEECEIAAGCVIGQDVTIGNRCRLDPNVVVYPRCRIGNDCIIQSNTTIGSTGFGYYFIDGAHRLIPHIGGVLIEDFVEIGANCCVDRAKFGDTVIGAGTKIDNLVQIAHNVVIGKCCLIAALAAMAGSARLEDGVVLAGKAGVGDHITIGQRSIVGAQTAAVSDIEPGKQVLGFPAIDQKTFWANYKAVMRLPRTLQQIEELKKKVARFEAEWKTKTDLS